jgi:hypothetical protein
MLQTLTDRFSLTSVWTSCHWIHSQSWCFSFLWLTIQVTMVANYEVKVTLTTLNEVNKILYGDFVVVVVNVNGVRRLWTAASNGPIIPPPAIYQYGEPRWNDTDRRDQRTGRETCVNATLPITNIKWTDPGANPGLSDKRPVTNRLSHGIAYDKP